MRKIKIEKGNYIEQTQEEINKVFAEKINELVDEINSQQPEVIACQGGGETVVSRSNMVKSLNLSTTADSFGKESRNPPADVNDS